VTTGACAEPGVTNDAWAKRGKKLNQYTRVWRLSSISQVWHKSLKVKCLRNCILNFLLFNTAGSGNLDGEKPSQRTNICCTKSTPTRSNQLHHCTHTIGEKDPDTSTNNLNAFFTFFICIHPHPLPIAIRLVPTGAHHPASQRKGGGHTPSWSNPTRYRTTQ